MTKQQLRANLIGLRSGMEPDGVRQKSQAITTRLLSEIDWRGVKQVHCYNAIPGEVQTNPFIGWLRAHNIEITSPAPRAATPSSHELARHYDLIVVPMLGFDLELHRLGYGGGFYDRLLSSFPQVSTVGLCFQLGLVVDGLPSEAHDRTLGMIVTEDRTYRA